MDPTHVFKGDPGSPLKKWGVHGSTMVKGACLQVLAGMGPFSLVTSPPSYVGDGRGLMIRQGGGWAQVRAFPRPQGCDCT